MGDCAQYGYEMCNFDGETWGYCEKCPDADETCDSAGYDTSQGTAACKEVCEAPTAQSSMQRLLRHILGDDSEDEDEDDKKDRDDGKEDNQNDASSEESRRRLRKLLGALKLQ